MRTGDATEEVVISAWLWLAFVALVLALVAVDLLAHRFTRRPDSWRGALAWSAGWIALALVFALSVWHFLGEDSGEEFLGAYLLEKSLSVDNLFVFMVIFQQLGIDAVDERRVLSWGVLGALVMRGLFIGFGVLLVAQSRFVLDVFGIVLIATALKLLFTKEEHRGEGRLLRWLHKKMPMATESRHRFFVRENGRLLGTPLLVALIAVELTDILFAVDSIPAAFAVTTSPFILYTSNVLALLGLRSLYVALAHGLRSLHYLRHGLVIVLLLAGAKMLAARVWHVPPFVSVLVIALVMGICVAMSLIRRRARPAH
jgi:tellurite resistance protein TerC